MCGNEVRTDFMGRRVIIASNRVKRPHDFAAKRSIVKPKICFFCPGNEHLTPPEIARVENGKGGWLIRCFPNKFAAVANNFKKAYGFHEVIVETPSHNTTLSEIPIWQMEKLLWMYTERIKSLEQNPRIQYVLIFKNEGEDAGASLGHTHTQLLASDFVPDLVGRELGAFSEYKKKGKCIFCEMIKNEKRRYIFENSEFIAFAPYASRFAFETWIMPKEHIPSITKLQNLEKMAEAMKRVLEKIDNSLNYPPYNYFLHNAPKGRDFHFHLEITPRLTKWAGLEIGGDVPINAMPPEKAARFLRIH
ncbi:MAG: DUF4921 family protein [Candidatus Micrarchaeia archaeon]